MRYGWVEQWTFQGDTHPVSWKVKISVWHSPSELTGEHLCVTLTQWVEWWTFQCDTHPVSWKVKISGWHSPSELTGEHLCVTLTQWVEWWTFQCDTHPVSWMVNMSVWHSPSELNGEHFNMTLTLPIGGHWRLTGCCAKLVYTSATAIYVQRFVCTFYVDLFAGVTSCLLLVQFLWHTQPHLPHSKTGGCPSFRIT